MSCTHAITRTDARAQNLRHYFTGVPCKRGHVAERFTCSKVCVECDAFWRAENAERLATEHRAQALKWRQENRDAHRAYARKWVLENPKKARATALAAERRRRVENPEIERVRVRLRRARMVCAEGRHTAADVQRIGAAQRWRCAWCRQPCKSNYHIDHVIALACGGSNAPSNIVVACPTCNLKKNKKDPISFARELGRLL